MEGCDISQNTLYSHHTDVVKDSDEFDKLHYIYQHFQDSEKMHQIDPERELTITDDDSLYLYVNNDIEYRLFEDIVDHSNTCTHDYYHITQSVQDLSDSTQQNTLHSIKENSSLFTDDTATHCDFNIIDQNSDIENANDTNVI